MMPGYWILDTGASLHAVGRNQLGPGADRYAEPAAEVQVHTANGKITANTCVPINIGILGRTVRPHLLESADALLSVGQLVKEGFTFGWPSTGPFLVTPDGRRILLRVDQENPVLDETCEVDGIDRCMPCGVATEGTYAEGGATSSTAPAAPAPIRGDDSDGVPDLIASDDEGDDQHVRHYDSDADNEESDVEESRVSRRERLLAVANTLAHQLCHEPKNPYCKHCNDAKATRVPARRTKESLDEEGKAIVEDGAPQIFGDRIHGDHVILKKDRTGQPRAVG